MDTDYCLLPRRYYGSATLIDECAEDDQDKESLVSAPSESAFSAAGWNSNYGWGSCGSTAGSGAGADGYGGAWGAYLSGSSRDGGGGCGGGGGGGCGGYQQYPHQHCLGEGNDDKLLIDIAQSARHGATSASAAGPGRRQSRIYRAPLANSSARLQSLPLSPPSPVPSTCTSVANASGRSYRRDLLPSLPRLSHLRLLFRSLSPSGSSGSGNAPRRLVLLVLAHCIVSLVFPDLLPSLFCSSSPASARSPWLAGLLARPAAWRGVVDWGGEVTVSYPPFAAAVAVGVLAVGLVGLWILTVAGRRDSAHAAACTRGPAISTFSRLVPV